MVALPYHGWSRIAVSCLYMWYAVPLTRFTALLLSLTWILRNE